MLLPGTYRINTDLFHLEIQDATVITAGKIGLVTSLDGEPLPESEFVAKPVTGHNDFLAASAFLSSGGQRGQQFDVLKPGTYYVNPLMFKVELDDVAAVQRGQVAVSNVGEEPQKINNLVEAEIGVKIAEQNKLKTIRFAEGEAESIRLRAEGEARSIKSKGDAEGSKILAVGESAARECELQNKALGPNSVTAIEVAKQISLGNVKITPDFLVQGGDNLAGLLSAFLTGKITAEKKRSEIKDIQTAEATGDSAR